MKFCEICGEEISTRDGENRCAICADAFALSTLQKKRIKARRKARHQAMLDLGLVRVRGALGGVYYE